MNSTCNSSSNSSSNKNDMKIIIVQNDNTKFREMKEHVVIKFWKVVLVKKKKTKPAQYQMQSSVPIKKCETFSYAIRLARDAREQYNFRESENSSLELIYFHCA